MNPIARNLQSIREEIGRAARECGRAPGDVLLLAVSKTFPPETIAEAVRAGQTRFGENRVQEAEGKIPLFGPDPKLEWHLIGHLQSNKARRAAELFDVIHSVDSLKLAARLDQAAGEAGRTLSVLLQADLAGEATKFGATPEEVRALLEAAAGWPNLRVDGLMTIPPFFDDPARSRPYFERLRRLLEELESERPGCLGRRHLSMGMSHDFAEAIREGATIVRVGTAIFGSRA
jgi:pyridoxal phosphate enzyme (YggS family)